MTLLELDFETARDSRAKRKTNCAVGPNPALDVIAVQMDFLACRAADDKNNLAASRDRSARLSVRIDRNEDHFRFRRRFPDRADGARGRRCDGRLVVAAAAEDNEKDDRSGRSNDQQ